MEKQLVVLDRSGGARRPIAGMDPIGVHRWQGALFLVGLSGDRPAIAAIDDDGKVGNVRTWGSSVAANDLGGRIQLIDDRSLPSNQITWTNPRTAMGPFPFLHEHALDHYAGDTTSWLVAGPSFEVGGEARTAIAYAPVGISYP